MPPMLVVCPPYDNVSLLLARNTVVGPGRVDVSFWVGEDFEMLV